jgi:integrase/recombinase XerD
MVWTPRLRLTAEFIQYRRACIRDHLLAAVSLSFGVKSFVQFKGKGRKERSVPLWHSTAKALQAWFRELDDSSSAVAFPNVRGSSLTRDGVNYILQQAVQRASASYPSLKNKRVFPLAIKEQALQKLAPAGKTITDSRLTMLC